MASGDVLTEGSESFLKVGNVLGLMAESEVEIALRVKQCSLSC